MMSLAPRSQYKAMFYRSNVGLFVQHWIRPESFDAKDWMINGVVATDIVRQTAAKDWLFLHGVDEITSVQKMGTPTKKLDSYRLRNPALASDIIPYVLLPGPADASEYQVGEYYDDNAEYWRWTKHEDIRSLYEAVHSDIPAQWMDVDLALTLVREIKIDSFDEPARTQVTMADHRGIWGDGKPKTVDLSVVVCYDDLEKMLTPEFLLHERPCALSSEQVYRIVRHHVKNNIVAKYARITSDYDFCFTVKRKIAIKPYTHRSENRTPTGKKMSRPTYKTSTIEHKEVEIFAMGHGINPYQGYVSIKGWQADNLEAMAEQVKSYLSDLMDEINRPVAECSHCNGTGHTDIGSIGTNERKI